MLAGMFAGLGAASVRIVGELTAAYGERVMISGLQLMLVGLAWGLAFGVWGVAFVLSQHNSKHERW
jgi:cytochrome c-type biogenesis protein CcmH/NrfF